VFDVSSCRLEHCTLWAKYSLSFLDRAILCCHYGVLPFHYLAIRLARSVAGRCETWPGWPRKKKSNPRNMMSRGRTENTAGFVASPKEQPRTQHTTYSPHLPCRRNDTPRQMYHSNEQYGDPKILIKAWVALGLLGCLEVHPNRQPTIDRDRQSPCRFDTQSPLQ
jgi:hypothetical protein